MKILARALLIAGLVVVLTPCACDEIAGWAGSSCHASDRGCCGGPETDLHSFMGKNASLGQAVQVPPMIWVVHVRFDPVLPVLPDRAGREIRALAGPSPPSFHIPLLI